MITSARIQSLYASERTRLAATGEDTHKTILQGLRTLVHGELRSHHGADGANPVVWEQAAVAIRAAGLWRDSGVPLGSRPKVTPTPGPTPYRCPFVTPGLAAHAIFEERIHVVESPSSEHDVPRGKDVETGDPSASARRR